MYNISLVCTRHAEAGKCNSDELYKIFEHINPEVIFEEIPPTFFDKYYLEKSRRNLESDTINRYIENHKIDHIPVDSDDLPSEEFFRDHKYMMKKIEGLIDINGFTYRNLIDINVSYSEKYGFKYLNDIINININDEINRAIENGLQAINNDKFFQTFKIWKDIIDKRENQMLQNIYRYSQEHPYNRAVFTIGASHRKSIIEKISECQKTEKVKLNWILDLGLY